MSKPLDRDGISAAMRDAAWKAVHGSREERSGVFNPTPAAKPVATKPPKLKARTAV